MEFEAPTAAVERILTERARVRDQQIRHCENVVRHEAAKAQIALAYAIQFPSISVDELRHAQERIETALPAAHLLDGAKPEPRPEQRALEQRIERMVRGPNDAVELIAAVFGGLDGWLLDHRGSVDDSELQQLRAKLTAELERLEREHG